MAEEVRQNESSRIEETTAMFVNKKKKKGVATRQREGRQKGFPGACFKCGRIGHYESDCRSSGKASGWDADQSNVAFNVMKCVTSENWIMDRGASANMSKVRAVLIDYTEMKATRNKLCAKRRKFQGAWAWNGRNTCMDRYYMD
uniref:AlNc14C109G6314 protein n=1 Tax=Albugo laibachii Nc14 TaxID=890382 RepID=F0WIB0_9STRA|nr:AlNc14C109G6314 [Albugo laibachii Nc14]|eukprot:CCA20989.1 AlNc14C109G6314 [Albugo laibachii Nc14]